MHFLKKSLAAAALLISLSGISAAQNISQPANPDTMFCNTRGSIATRLATRWQCLVPGLSGQVLKSNGPNADAGWLTVTGTGTVSSVDMTVPGALLAVSGNPITTAGTLAVTLPTQTTNTIFAAPNGSTGTPTFRALAGADIPAVNLAGTGNGGVTGTLPLTAIPTVTVAKGGTNATSASGMALDNITGFAGTGILRRTGAGTYTQGTTVSVAEGGTGATAASGTALDNISGFSTTGVITRSGAGTYSLATIPATLGSQTANTFFAAPNGSAGNPSFRVLAAGDIPTSIALGGNPTTTTQAALDNSTRIATTAYVDAAVSTLPGGPTFLVQSTDQTNATSTLANSTNLIVPMVASTNYWIDADILGVSSTTNNAGFTFGFSLSAAATSCQLRWTSMSGASATTGSSVSTSAAQHTLDTGPATGQSLPMGYHVAAECHNGASASNFAFSFANGSGGTVTLYAGSHLSYSTF